MRDFVAMARGSLVALAGWAIMAAGWNFAGVWRLSNGHKALGPTATIQGALVLAVGVLALRRRGAQRAWCGGGDRGRGRSRTLEARPVTGQTLLRTIP